MSSRSVVAASVLAAWAVGLGLLFARELNPSPAARLADVSLRVVPITTYYVVEDPRVVDPRVVDRGTHVGFASIAIDTVPHALQVTEYLVTESTAGARHTEQLAVTLSRGLSLKEFESTSTNGPDTTRVTGRVADSTLFFTAATPTSIPVSLPAFAGVIGATVTVLLDQPRVGATSTLAMIDPATGRSSSRATRVAAESLFVVVDSAVADSSGRWFAVHRDTVRAWHLVATDTPPLDAWIDAQGLVVESRLPNGLLLRRTAFELAFENWRQAHPDRAVSARGDGSVVSGTWLASGAPRPTQTLDSLRVRLGASIPAEFAARYGRNYRAGGRISYGRVDENRLRSRYALPTTDRWRNVFTKELSPGPSIESDDPSIARRAVALAGDERDPAVITRRIVSWVHDSLRAESGAPPIGALGALGRRFGDAREFALLTTALARAAGVPAHPVTGLLQHEGRFYVHAWTEVYLGRWIPVDAMLDQYPADASHITFMTGAAEPGPDLARILNRLELRVIKAIRAQ